MQQPVHPKSDAEQLRVVRLHDLVVGLSRALAPLPTASGANAEKIRLPSLICTQIEKIICSSLPSFWIVVGVLAVKELVPYLDKESAVVRLVHERLGVVTVVLYVTN